MRERVGSAKIDLRGVGVPQGGYGVVKNEYENFENVKKWISAIVEYDVVRLSPATLRPQKHH